MTAYLKRAVWAVGITGLAIAWWSLAPAPPRPPPATPTAGGWWPSDPRYGEQAVFAFAEDLVADGLAREIVGFDCAEYPCLVAVMGWVPRDRYADLSVAMSIEDARFVRRETDAGYLPGGMTNVDDTADAWVVTHVTAALARPIDAVEMDRLGRRIEALTGAP